jgi:hypothetical protein
MKKIKNFQNILLITLLFLSTQNIFAQNNNKITKALVGKWILSDFKVQTTNDAPDELKKRANDMQTKFLEIKAKVGIILKADGTGITFEPKFHNDKEIVQEEPMTWRYIEKAGMQILVIKSGAVEEEQKIKLHTNNQKLSIFMEESEEEADMKVEMIFEKQIK